MKRLVAIFLTLSFSTLSFADSTTQPAVNPEFKAEFISFMQGLVERLILEEALHAMKDKNYTQAQIQEVLDSQAVKNYGIKVAHHPRVLKAIDHYFQTLTQRPTNDGEDPSKSEDTVERTLALKKFMMEKHLPRAVVAYAPHDSLWNRLLEQVRRMVNG